MNARYIGQTISHYRIIGQLGAGGMGEVYRAEDQHLHRTVALKFLSPASVEDDVARQRFMREARAASALDHPNICTIHDIDEAPDGRLFISMACYDGETLRQAIGRGPLRIEDAIGIARQLAEGLAKAHDEGITHRDLHPGNILITSERMVKIVDFGLATLAGATRLTQSNVAAGTLAYMSPEQLRGEDAGAPSDIWSFGVVLFEMLSGRLPLRADHPAALCYAIANEEPADLAALRKEVPGSLVKLCQQCLRKNPAERPHSMHDVLAMLGHWPFDISSGGSPALRSLRTHYFVPLLITVLLLVLFVVYLIFRPAPVADRTMSRIKLGILPFSLAITDSSTGDWPLLAQRLLAADLTGYENAGVVDPLSLNSMLGEDAQPRQLSAGTKILRAATRSGITLLVDGAVYRTDKGITLRTTLIHPENGEASFSCEAICSHERGLLQATGQLAKQIIDFVDVQADQGPGDPDLRSWMQRHPANFAATKAFLQAAQLFFVGGSGSEKELRTAIALDSTFLAPRIWLIPGLVLTGRREEALYQIRQLRALETSASPFEKAMINWAAAYLNNDLAGQARHLHTALSYSPENNILLFNLARTEYLMEDFAAAVNTLQGPVSENWAYPPAHYLLGASYHATRKYSEARHTLEHALTLKSVYPSTYALLASLYAREGDNSNADTYEVKYLNAARDAGMAQATASATIAGIYLADGFGQRALRHYDVAVLQEPRNAAYHEERGEAFEQAGDTAGAMECYHRAILCDSLQGAAHLRLGRIFDHRAQFADALLQYRSYLQFDSTSNEAREVFARSGVLQQLTSSHRP
jgi:tetratricopeptide (TPR) repeat protein